MSHQIEITVKDLLEKLQGLDPDMPVVRYVGEDMYERPQFNPIKVLEVAEDVYFAKAYRTVLQIG